MTPKAIENRNAVFMTDHGSRRSRRRRALRVRRVPRAKMGIDDSLADDADVGVPWLTALAGATKSARAGLLSARVIESSSQSPALWLRAPRAGLTEVIPPSAVSLLALGGVCAWTTPLPDAASFASACDDDPSTAGVTRVASSSDSGVPTAAFLRAKLRPPEPSAPGQRGASVIRPSPHRLP